MSLNLWAKRLAEVAEGTAKAHRCSTEYDLLINGPAVVNDSEMVAIVREAAADVLGPNASVMLKC